MNFILKYTGTEKPDLKRITAILEAHQVQVLDHSLLPKTALVKVNELQLNHLKRDLDNDWEITPEKIYQVPTTKKKINRD